MCHHAASAALRCGPVWSTIEYAAGAKALGALYEQQLARRPAGRSIAAMWALPALVCAEGVDNLKVKTAPSICEANSSSDSDSRFLTASLNSGESRPIS
jgi:hypothetical protein